MKSFLIVFLSVFIAELGDKTQVATLLYATDAKMSKMGVFAASSIALTMSCLLMVLFGEQITRLISPQTINTIAGIGFIGIGIWTLVR